MGNEVTIILKAVDRASSTLKGATGSIKGMLTTIGAFSGAAIAAGAAIKKIADDTTAYNKSIRQLTQVTGTGAEEISRIVQVADDWGIEIGQARTALVMMNKNGMKPSIDNLAKLADEYVNTTDKTAFAEKAVKILGRQYATLIPLLAKGGQAFRDQAAAIDESLIATDASIAASREYEVALDNLNDKVLALKLSIGNVLVPILTQLLTPAVEETINGQKFLVQKIGDTTRAFKQVGQATIDATAEYLALTGQASGTGMSLDKFKGIVEELNGALDANAGVLDENAGAMDSAQAVYNAAQKKLAEYNITLKNQINLEQELALLTGETTAEEIKRDQVLGFLTKQLDMGRISGEQYLEILGKMASGAYSLEEAIKAITAAINGMPTSKTVTIKLNYVNPAAGEPGPDVPVVIPGGGNEGNYGGKKAGGGPVMAGMSYLVGEQGPEIFTPGRSGGITPNGAMGGDVFADITINAAPGMDVNAIAAAVVARLNTARRVQSSGGAYRGV